MPENRELDGKNLLDDINHYLNKRKKEGLPAKVSLNNFFLDVIISCKRCEDNRDEQLERVRKGLDEAEKRDFCSGDYQKYIQFAKSLCYKCSMSGKPLSAVFELVAKTLDRLES